MSVLALFLSFAVRARGYSVDNHERLTRESVLLVDRCRVCSNRRGPSAAPYRDVLVEYNRKQDGLFRKLAMWHFPAPKERGKLSGLAFLFCPFATQKDFELWTRSLWTRVRGGLTARELYPALGAALHYVQDVAVPAHAVPVFHPSFKGLTDDFDDYEGWRGYGADLLPCEQLAVPCREVLEPAPLDELLERGRKQTQSALALPLTMHDPDGRASVHTWREFWVAPRKNAFRFGEYDCRPFGGSTVTCGHDRFEVEPEQFFIFATARARATIRAGARAVVSFERHLTRCQERHCEPAHDDLRFLPDRATLHEIEKQTGVH